MEKRIKGDYITAMKNKDAVKKTALSLLLNSINNEKKVVKIDANDVLPDEMVEKIIVKEIKKRNQSIEQYTKSQRLDLATQEEQELNILQSYLPEPFTQEELVELIKTLKSENEGIIKGKFIGLVLSKVNGRNPVNEVNKLINEIF